MQASNLTQQPWLVHAASVKTAPVVDPVLAWPGLCCVVLCRGVCLQTELLDPELNALEYMMREYKDIPLEKMRSVVRSHQQPTAGVLPRLGSF